MSHTGRTQALRVAMLATALLALVIASPAAVATFPGDAGLIMFQDDTDEGVQVFTMKPDGTGIRQLTHIEPGPGAEFPGASRADWSPDGRTIVFNENDCAIAFIDADGSDLRRVAPEQVESADASVCEGTPAFTPDGRSIVYDRCQGMTCETWAMDVEGTNRRLVSNVCGAVPQVSPDGMRIATKGCKGLMVQNIDGTDARQVTPDLDIAWKLDWAPDGSAIVFSDKSDPTPSDTVNLATVAPDGTDMRYLTDYTEPGTFANVGSFSPSGDAVLFRLEQGGQYALAIAHADGSGVEQLTEFSAFLPRYLDWGAAPTTAGL